MPKSKSDESLARIEIKRDQAAASIGRMHETFAACHGAVNAFAQALRAAHPTAVDPLLTSLAGQQPPASTKRKRTTTKTQNPPQSPKPSAASSSAKSAPSSSKKHKSPLAPKRPASAYLLFQNDVRREVRDANPDMPYHDVLSQISKAWKALPEKDKAPYEQESRTKMSLYKTQSALFNKAIDDGMTPQQAAAHMEQQQAAGVVNDGENKSKEESASEEEGSGDEKEGSKVGDGRKPESDELQDDSGEHMLDFLQMEGEPALTAPVTTATTAAAAHGPSSTSEEQSSGDNEETVVVSPPSKKAKKPIPTSSAVGTSAAQDGGPSSSEVQTSPDKRKGKAPVEGEGKYKVKKHRKHPKGDKEKKQRRHKNE